MILLTLATALVGGVTGGIAYAAYKWRATGVIFFTVQPTANAWYFPLDMLSQGRCWPAQTADAAYIMETIKTGPDYLRVHGQTITLASYEAPQAGFWGTFGWTVEVKA